MRDHQVIFDWESPEYELNEKTNDWFWGVGIGGLCIIITTIIWENYLFGIFIFLSIIVIFILNTKKPRMLHKQITDQGIIVDDMFFAWNKINRFCITREKNPRLIIETNGLLHPQIFINLHKEGLNPEDVRDYLNDHIKEEMIELSFFKQLAEKI